MLIADIVKNTNYFLTKISNEGHSRDITEAEFRSMINKQSGSKLDFSYTGASLCTLEFTSSVTYEPIKTLVLSKIISNECSLLLPTISYNNIMSKATSSSAVPLFLLLKQSNNETVATIDLENHISQNINYYIPSQRHSEILYRSVPSYVIKK